MNSELPITDSYHSLFTFIIAKIAIVHNVHKINSALFSKLFVFFAIKYGIFLIISFITLHCCQHVSDQ